jgi:hypothetical protein
MRTRRLVIGVLLMALATSGLSVATARSAFAAGCYGSSCTGQDPQAQGCAATGVTLESADPPGGGGNVQLRVSRFLDVSDPGCHAAWARMYGYEEFIIQGSTTSDGSNIVKQYGSVGGTDNGNVRWTDMIDYGLWVRACVKGIFSDNWSCTHWH